MPRNGSDWRRYQILVLAAVFTFFAVDRFYRITEIGMTGTDTFTYWSIATDWVKGHDTLTEHYRPVLYLLYSMAMSIFGENDYSIKILNASLDMLTILFIFLTARKLTKNLLVSTAACSLYALLPGPLIYAARSELSHASTTFFLTAGMYAFTFYYGKGKTEKSLETGMLVVSGFLFGCAANTHPDVVLVGPIFIILLLRAHVVHKNARIHQIIIAFGLFTLAFFVPFICAGAYFGFKNTLNNIFTNYQRQGQDSSSNIIDTFRALKGIQQGYFEFFATNLMKYVFVGMLVVNLFLYIFRSKGSSVSIFLLPMLFHYVAYCVLIHRSHLYRLFKPWLPSLMLYICYWI